MFRKSFKLGIIIGSFFLVSNMLEVAAEETVTIKIVYRKDNTFSPQRIKVPANKVFVLHVDNETDNVIEVENDAARLEKLIPPEASGQAKLGPLSPGEYSVFNEYLPQGGTIVLEAE